MTEELGNNNGLDEEETVGGKIDALLDKGFSARQLRKMGFASATIRQRLRKRTKEKGMPEPENRTNGKGEVALTIKEKETVLPEWLEGQVSELFDGSVAQQKAFVAGMAIPLLGMRMWAEGCKPILELMRVDQARQAEAVRAQQGSADEVAQKTVVAAIPYITIAMKEVAKISAPKEPNPLGAMMVRMIETPMSQVFQQMFGMFGRPPQQGQQPGQSQPSQPPLPPGWEYSPESKEE